MIPHLTVQCVLRRRSIVRPHGLKSDRPFVQVTKCAEFRDAMLQNVEDAASATFDFCCEETFCPSGRVACHNVHI